MHYLKPQWVYSQQSLGEAMNWQIKNRTKQIKSITSQNTSGGDLNEKWCLWEDFPQKRPGILGLGWWCSWEAEDPPYRGSRRNYNTIASESSGKKVKTTTSQVCRVSDSFQELMVFFCVVSYFCSWQVLLSSCSPQNLQCYFTFSLSVTSSSLSHPIKTLIIILIHPQHSPLTLTTSAALVKTIIIIFINATFHGWAHSYVCHTTMRFNQSPEHITKMQTNSQLIPPLLKFVFYCLDNTIPRSGLEGKKLILLMVTVHHGEKSMKEL